VSLALVTNPRLSSGRVRALLAGCAAETAGEAAEGAVFEVGAGCRERWQPARTIVAMKMKGSGRIVPG
jgi:hypothetical protein